jgi:hypothetical protein
LPKGKSEIGTGYASASYGLVSKNYYTDTPYGIFCDQSIIFFRKGIGNKMDIGLDLGLLYMSFDIRKQILDESRYIPAISASFNAFIVSSLFWGLGGGPAISIQLSKGNLFANSKLACFFYSGSDFLSGDSYSEKTPFLIGNIGYEIHIYKHFYIAPLIGVSMYKRDLRGNLLDNEYLGISFLFR